MASVEEICNLALAMIGQNPITDINDTTTPSVRCKSVYEIERDALLRLWSWNFATRRVTLELDATEPAYGYAYRFPLPADYLCVQEVDSDTSAYPFRVEERWLLSNSETVSIKYTRRIQETGLFDPAFTSCLALRIASRLALSITRNATLARTMMELFEMEFNKAKGSDVSEGTPIIKSQSTWEDAR